MKTFLEEYGFVILIAIVIILLIVIATPIGNTIKASILGLTDSFGSKTVAKIDKTSKEVNTTLKGSELAIESTSETDKYIAILRGYQGGKEVSVASVGDKLTCTDSMSNVATFAGATGAAETTSGIAKFIIENGDKLDENTKYYIEIMNIGTGEIFKSDVMMMDYQKLVSSGGSGGTGGSSGSGGSSTIDMSNVSTTLASGDFSTKGNLVTVNGKSYRVLESSGTQAKLLAMDSHKLSKFNSLNVTTSFGGTTGQKYAGSVLDNEMTNFYNGLPAELQNAIVEQNISQSMYRWTSGTNASANFSAWYANPFTDATTSGNNYYLTRIAEVNVGARKVFALDLDDAISYLGANSTAKDVNEMFFGVRNNVPRYVWLRSAYSGYSNRAFYVYGNYGYLNINYCSSSYEVRPAFVLDLSLLS